MPGHPCAGEDLAHRPKNALTLDRKVRDHEQIGTPEKWYVRLVQTKLDRQIDRGHR